jgi:DNA/RNA endonuclease YhcR with UshA esterase domain
MRKTSLLATVGFGGLLLAMPAFGHHAFSAEFDANKPITLTGTVTSVEWQNPHTWFYIDVKDEAGNIANWGLELASPNLLLRNGWTRNTMKIGDVVTVESFRAKNGSNIANARSITLTATGQKLLGGSSQGGRTQ